jgi:fluoroquinolone resistance protein
MELSGGQSEFTSEVFRKLNYRGEKFKQKEFNSCSFIKCVFDEAVFEHCTFRSCTFKDCEMNLVRVPGSTFTENSFENSRLVGVNWTESSLAHSKITFGKPASFSGCALNHSIFMWLTLKDIFMVKCTAHDVDFSEANLANARCTGTDFANSRFWHTDLSGADFRGATNYTIAANLNTLKKTKFSLPEAMALLYSLDILLEDGE